MSIGIQNCKFAFQCDKKWDDLVSAWTWTKVKYCGDCKRSVYLCESDEELGLALKQDYCVAVPANITSKASQPSMLIGRVSR